MDERRRQYTRRQHQEGSILMQELDRRVGLLRLLLADLTARERQAREATEQLHLQLSRLADFTVRFNTSVTTALSSMDEVGERLEQQQRQQRHLALLQSRAQSELDALLVTRNVADARARLAALERRRSHLLAGTDAALPLLEADAPALASPKAATSLADLTPALSSPAAPPPVAAAPALPTASTPGSELAEIEAEIAEVRAAIDAASDAAARSLAAHDMPPHHAPPHQ